MKLQHKLRACSLNKTALLAVNFYNFETLEGLLLGAQQTNSSLILQLSESSIKYLGIEPAVHMAKSMLKQFNIQGWLHLDHGMDIDLIQKCLDAGFDSVMIDASEKPFAENVRITAKVVDMAQFYGAHVEAELGYVAKLGQDQRSSFTTAEDAKRFEEATGIDALAIAIGSAHGFYKEPPHLDIERLKEIRAETRSTLVLHGSSGIPDMQLVAAVNNGISKINLATETKNTFMRKLQQLMGDIDEIDLRKVFPEAIEEVRKLIVHKLNVINATKHDDKKFSETQKK